MDITGKSFDMDPKTFTLARIFKMELHNFAAQIGYVLNVFFHEMPFISICTFQSFNFIIIFIDEMNFQNKTMILLYIVSLSIEILIFVG